MVVEGEEELQRACDRCYDDKLTKSADRRRRCVRPLTGLLSGQAPMTLVCARRSRSAARPKSEMKTKPRRQGTQHGAAAAAADKRKTDRPPERHQRLISPEKPGMASVIANFLL
jgi:hypothetical protein